MNNRKGLLSFFNTLTLASLFFSANALANKKITIDLTKQRLIATENNKTYINTKVSTGMYGHATPSGNFNVIAKIKKNFSTLYPRRSSGKNGGASMPYTIRITFDGVAIHEGRLPRRNGKVYPASHGCIRISKGVARKLYKWTPLNTTVEIIGKTQYTDRYNRIIAKYKKTLLDDNFDEKTMEAVDEYYEEFSNWGEEYYEDDTFY